MPDTILIVDDDTKMTSAIADVLHHRGFRMLTAANGNDGFRVFESNPVDIVLLDIILPDCDGMDLLKRLLQAKPSVPVVMITGVPTIQRAVAATKLGAYDFLEKPLEPQRVLLTIRNALERSSLEKSQAALVQDMMDRYGLIGVSDAIRKVCTTASRIAKLEMPVLVTGENGTGKELLANVIHELSGRKKMICMNCAAIPHELIESEMFGHKKGSFTGAVAENIGKFQAAHEGTLFLDEIGDMSVGMQAKVLRALETKEVTKVGENNAMKVDVRFIAATNKNLVEEIEKGRFREDLYHRLRGIVLHIPPLRERREDIGPLGRHFLANFCRTSGFAEKSLTATAIERLEQEHWPGNVRELRHFIDNLAVFSDGEIIDHLQVVVQIRSVANAATGAPHWKEDRGSYKETTDSFEKDLILKALQESHGNITHAAAKLNIDRATLSKKIKRYGLK